MTRSFTAPEEEDFFLPVGDEYYCPVCGNAVARSDFETPERDYYCPYCSTRQTPSTLRAS